MADIYNKEIDIIPNELIKLDDLWTVHNLLN